MQRYIIWPLIKEEISLKGARVSTSLCYRKKKDERRQSQQLQIFLIEGRTVIQRSEWHRVDFGPPSIYTWNICFRSNPGHHTADLWLGGQSTEWSVGQCSVAPPRAVSLLEIGFASICYHTTSSVCKETFPKWAAVVNSGDFGQLTHWNQTTLLRVRYPAGHDKHCVPTSSTSCGDPAHAFQRI